MGWYLSVDLEKKLDSGNSGLLVMHMYTSYGIMCHKFHLDNLNTVE